MPTPQYSSHDKIAIVSLLIEMANADGNIDVHEMLTANDIFCRLEIDDITFNIGRTFSCDKALKMIADWDKPKAVAVKDLLIRIIEADGMVHLNEFKILKLYCEATGLNREMNF